MALKHKLRNLLKRRGAAYPEKEYLEQRFDEQLEFRKYFLIFFVAMVFFQVLQDFLALLAHGKGKIMYYCVKITGTLIMGFIFLFVTMWKKTAKKWQTLSPGKREVMVFLFGTPIVLIINILAMTGVLMDEKSNTGEDLVLSGIAIMQGLLWVQLLIFVFFVHWIYKVLGFLVCGFIIIGVFTYFDKMHSNYVVLFIKVMVLTLLIVFIQEKSLRNTFLKRKESKETSKSLTSILGQLNENILIMSCGDKEILYENIVKKDMCNRRTQPHDAMLNSISLRRSQEAISHPLHLSSFHSNFLLEGFDDSPVEVNSINYLSRIVDLRYQPSGSDYSEVLLTRINEQSNLKDLLNKILEEKELFEELRRISLLHLNGKIVIKEDKAEECYYKIQFSVANYNNKESIVLILTDITQSMMYYKNINEMQENILSSLSHELITPLNGTLTFMKNVEADQNVPQEVKDRFVIPSCISIQLLHSFIQDTLDFVQIKKGGLTLHVQKFRVMDLVSELEEFFKPIYLQKKLKFTVTTANFDSSYYIHTDMQRTRQVLLNLLNNAGKFTFQGEIAMCIEVDDDSVKFTIRDTGIGMTLEETFGLREKLSGETGWKMVSSHSTGAGLGLLYSNALAKELNPLRHNGLKFDSIINEGSAFAFSIENIVLLDLESSFVSDCHFGPELDEMRFSASFAAIPMSSEIKIKNEMQNSRHKKKIVASKTHLKSQSHCKCPEFLVVDDDVFNQLTLVTIIESLGKKAETASNGQIALEKVTEKRKNECDAEHCNGFIAVFMDCNMPVMDGYQATREIKTRILANKWQNTTIIGCTAYVNPEKLSQCLESGMDTYFNKPISKAKVMQVLRDLHLF